MTGILTIAQGAKRYLDMAKMLALSLQVNYPDLKRAVVTDAPAEAFGGLFDIYVPYQPEYGKGLNQKLYLDKYSPFEQTIFIDADCLVIRPLTELISMGTRHDFMAFGGQISTGEWYMDVAEICKKFKVPSIPLFNGGTYYFTNSQLSKNIFARARELNNDYQQLGFKPFRGCINEEPLISVAMALNHVNGVDDMGSCMRTPIGINGALSIDVLRQQCRFIKEDEAVQPAILHFSGDYTAGFHYKREIAKLKAYQKVSFLNKTLISAGINILFNSGYASLVFCKRIAKVLLRRQRFNFRNLLPVYSSQ